MPEKKMGRPKVYRGKRTAILVRIDETVFREFHSVAARRGEKMGAVLAAYAAEHVKKYK